MNIEKIEIGIVDVPEILIKIDQKELVEHDYNPVRITLPFGKEKSRWECFKGIFAFNSRVFHIAFGVAIHKADEA